MESIKLKWRGYRKRARRLRKAEYIKRKILQRILEEDKGGFYHREREHLYI